MRIPFNKPTLGKNEIASIAKVIISGRIGGNGPIGQKLESYIERLFNVKFALLTTSCTHALEIAMMALGIKEGDEVILPSFSFVSAANAIARLKAKPLFVDIEEDHLNIDPLKIKESITKRTKAIICVHYAGVSCKMKEILKIANGYNLYLIEDAAQAVGSKYRGKFLGTIGDIGCFSFHETKIFTCGEGGAFLTNDKNVAKEAEIIREKGTNRSEFLRGGVDKYTWLDIGSSYVLSEILAVLLLKQLQRFKYIISKRRDVGIKYIEGLKKLEEKDKIILPKFDFTDDLNWHIFYFRVHNQKERDLILRKLREKGIEATFHFLPLHLSPYAKKTYGYKKGDLPVTEKVSSTLIRLPIYPDLSDDKQKYIINSLYRILK